MNGRQRFMAAVQGKPVDRPPVWFMRQAGRYLPEYREVRSRHSFTEMYKNPDVAAEVTLQPIRRFGMDAAILFSDILVVPEALGIPVTFPEGGPVLGASVRDEAAIEALRPVDVEKSLSFVFEALTNLRKALGDETALIGFAGAPYTLATYMVEGGSTRKFETIKRMEYERPDLLEKLLDKITDVVEPYLLRQIACGADAVQMFDSWGGNLDPVAYRRFCTPRIERLCNAVRKAGGRSIAFALGSSPFLEAVADAGPDVVGIDWHTSMSDAVRRVGAQHGVQGNLDPAALYARPAVIEAKVREIAAAGAKARGHVFNLGHGLTPGIPVAGVEAAVNAVKALGRSSEVA